MAHWLVIGGNSDIALAILRQVSPAEIARLTLVGRNESELERRSSDLQARLSCEVEVRVADLADAQSMDAMAQEVAAPDVLLLAAGELMDTADLLAEPGRLRATLRVNFEAMICLTELLAPRMVAAGGGSIVVLNSVAGLRGRPSNYVYGATKAGLATYLQGLRLRFAEQHLQVLNVLNGMVATKMTENRPLPKALLAKPDDVGRVICRAIGSAKSEIYAPWYWRWVMLVIRVAPGFLVKRL